MARVALRMMFHDRAKLLGTLLGVVFAVVLASQQLGVFLGLVQRNTMLVDRAGADVWIAPPETNELQPGQAISIDALPIARATEGVAWAEPMLFGAGTVRRPDGGSYSVSIVGTALPRAAGGPWNLVAGDTSVLEEPDTMIFEDSQRGRLGGLNLGDVSEVNRRRVVAGGFTWGLQPFGPSYAFAEYELARELLRVPRDRTSFVLVGVQPGVSPDVVKERLASRLRTVDVFTERELHDGLIRWLLAETALGVTFGTSTGFSLIVGFVIVALAMFSAVVDNIRVFGTLKAIGATNGDLALLLFVQALAYAVLGTTLGLFLVTQISELVRSPDLALRLPPPLFGAAYVVMSLLCIVASALSLLRVRRVEPGMVFR
jgi:putative ABC transport system permease protein